jgi:hypothetical protein
MKEKGDIDETNNVAIPVTESDNADTGTPI